MDITYRDSTEIFLAQYGITPEIEEFVLLFLDDAEGI